MFLCVIFRRPGPASVLGPRPPNGWTRTDPSLSERERQGKALMSRAVPESRIRIAWAKLHGPGPKNGRVSMDKRQGSSFRQDKYKAGNATLKLRDEMKDELEHWPMAAAADHAKFDVYPTCCRSATRACRQRTRPPRTRSAPLAACTPRSR